MRDEVTNFYEVIPKDLIKSYKNLSYDAHLFSLPFRAILVGGSGSGKTQLIMEIIKRMKKTFNKIVLCCRDSDEPLYAYLKKKVKDKDLLEVYENGEIPDPSQYAGSDDAILMIFDDLVNMKDQSNISEYYIRGRKIAGGISLIYSTQNYDKVPKTVRLQCNYALLKKLNCQRVLYLILSDYNLGLTKQKLLEVYKDAVSKSRQEFLCIRMDNPQETRFSRNFLELLPVEY